MRKLMLLLAALTFVMLEIHAAPPADNNKKQPAKQAQKPKSKNQRLAEFRKNHPFVQAKTGETVSCLLLSNVVITGKIYRIKNDAVWIDDGTVKLKQNRDMLSMETRAKFWKEDYNLYINEQIDKEILQESFSKSQGNSSYVADKKDPKFNRSMKKSVGNRLKKKK